MSKLNTGRKFFATAATAALVASAIVPVASAAEFSDADQIASWAKDAVETLSAQEVISGNPDGSFAPTGNVTRAQAAKMFTVALGLSTEGTEDFADVKDGQWFKEYVVAVVNAGIVNGMSATEFAPNANLTRAQAAKMIVEAYGLEGEADLKAFADANTVAGKWSEAYLSTAVATGVINGKGDKLAANESISRQEFAVMLTRAIDATADNEAELLAAVEEATKALDTAVKALNTEVKADEIAAAKAEVATAKAAITELEAAVEAAKEVVTEQQATAAKEAIAAANKSIEATEAVIAKAEEDAKVLAVESVKLLSATQVEVKFNKAVKESSVIENGKLKSGVAVFAELGSAKEVKEADLTAKLSEDGKTLVITTAQVFEGRYDITIEKAADKDGKELSKYEAKTVEFAKDTTAPTITGTERVSATKVKVLFSEPVKFAKGAVTADTAKVQSGTVAINELEATTAVTEVIVDLSNSSIAIDKEIKLTFNGVEDAVGNLINPQPSTVTVKKEAVDTVAPTLTAVTQTGVNTFSVKFDKVANLTAIEVSGSTVKTFEKVSDTEYKVTVNENLKGLQKVTVKAGKVSNNDGTVTTADLTKTVTFATDEKAPKATSKLVTVDGVEYIELSFDKDVILTGDKKVTISGSYVDNYVTKTLSAVSVEAKYADAKAENKKVVLLPLTGTGLDVKGATYDVKIVNTTTTVGEVNTVKGITSQAGTEVEEITAKFTRGENKPVATTNTAVVKEVAAKVVADNNDQVSIEFTIDGEYKLDGATATDLANYVVNGAVVESVSLKEATTTTDGTVKTTKQVVTLNLKKDSNSFTGTRNVTVKNVKVAGSTKVMEETTVKSESIKENIRPTFSSAVVTDGKEITLSYSEAIAFTNELAFDVKIGGLVESGAKAKVDTTTGNVVITLADALTNEELAKTITVEPTKTSSNFVVKDAAGNLLEKFDVQTASIANN